MIWYWSAVLHQFHILRSYVLSGGLACKLLMVCYALISYYVLSTLYLYNLPPLYHTEFWGIMRIRYIEV